MGFVPTMGALHKGHLSLASRAKLENDLCVCSIFVNPTQFNNQDDYDKYPRALESDIELFRSVNVDAVFMPSVEEMYPEKSSIDYDLGGLDWVMEGKYRPGHFNGVVTIVKKLFDLIQPDRAYFGEKDFQQLAIIRYIVKNLALPVEIVSCPIIRENDGLAMSSRNQRLNAEERNVAPLIYRTLLEAKKKLQNNTLAVVKEWVTNEIKKCSLMKLEYFEIVNSETLAICDQLDEKKAYNACIAVFVGAIRLIDNIKIS